MPNGARAIENIIDNLPDGHPTRRARILDSAARAFATHGYRASSLRDIAKDAGCSLTLLDHYFGGKGMLLEAVIKGQHENCHKRLAGLKALLASAGTFDFEQFLAVWVNYEFDLYATRQGRQYLKLMLRLSTDDEVDAQLRRHLNCSEALVLEAFARALPSLDEPALRGGWRMASAALYAAVTSAGDAQDAGAPDPTTAPRARAIAFLVDGLHALWKADIGSGSGPMANR